MFLCCFVLRFFIDEKALSVVIVETKSVKTRRINLPIKWQRFDFTDSTNVLHNSERVLLNFEKIDIIIYLSLLSVNPLQSRLKHFEGPVLILEVGFS